MFGHVLRRQNAPFRLWRQGWLQRLSYAPLWAAELGPLDRTDSLQRGTSRWQVAGQAMRRAPYRSVSPATPSARLTPTDPSTDSGCNAIDRLDPPTSAFAPTTMPSAMSPLAPTSVPARARR